MNDAHGTPIEIGSRVQITRSSLGSGMDDDSYIVNVIGMTVLELILEGTGAIYYIPSIYCAVIPDDPIEFLERMTV